MAEGIAKDVTEVSFCGLIVIYFSFTNKSDLCFLSSQSCVWLSIVSSYFSWLVKLHWYTWTILLRDVLRVSRPSWSQWNHALVSRIGISFVTLRVIYILYAPLFCSSADIGTIAFSMLSFPNGSFFIIYDFLHAGLDIVWLQMPKQISLSHLER